MDNKKINEYLDERIEYYEKMIVKFILKVTWKLVKISLGTKTLYQLRQARINIQETLVQIQAHQYKELNVLWLAVRAGFKAQKLN